MKVLVVDHSVPRPGHNAGDRAVADLVGGLVDLGHDVAFYPDGFPEGFSAAAMPPDVDPLAARHLVGEPGTGPAGLVEWLSKAPPEVAIVSRPGTGAVYLDLLETVPSTARVLFGHDLHATRLERGRPFGAPTARPAILAMSAVERHCWRGYDVPVYPSRGEADHVDRALGEPGRAAQMPIYRFDPVPAPSVEGRHGCAFVGGVLHAPNDDAVRWFAERILPEVRRRRPGTDLTVVGDWPDHRRHVAEGVTYTGLIDETSLDELMERVRVVVAPLRWGAGVKRKVVAAMHRGIPVVSTSVGLEGIGATAADGTPRAIEADTAEDFVHAVCRLLDDDELWHALSTAAHRSIVDEYGDVSYRRALENVMGLAVERARRRRPIRPGEPTCRPSTEPTS